MEEVPQPIAALSSIIRLLSSAVCPWLLFAEQISLSGWARGFPNEIPDLEFHFGVARGRGVFFNRKTVEQGPSS